MSSEPDWSQDSSPNSRDRPRHRSPWLIALLVVTLAASLRFYKVGDWSFSGEEVATLMETRALFDDPSSAAHDSQIFRLPRAIPATYFVNRLGYAIFGWDELGSRVVSVLAGVLLVVVAFLLGDKAFGRRMALILAILVAFSPAYVVQSQTNRFYSLTALVAGVAMLAGSVAIVRRSVAWTVVAVALAVLAAMSHTVSVLLLAILCAGIMVTSKLETWPAAAIRTVLVVFGAASVAVGGLILVYVWPFLREWNEEVAWGYSPARSVFASINMVGWPMALLAGLGMALMLEGRWPQRWYWIASVAAWLAASMTLPVVMTYHPWYMFPLALGALVCAAYATSDLYTRLRTAAPAVSAVWLAVVVCLNLPSLASHYVDGSRADLRAAIQYVSSEWEASDAVATPSIFPFGHYAPDLEPVFLLPRGDGGAAELQRLAAIHERLWVVLPTGRSGAPVAVWEWLAAHSTHRFHVGRQRFDYSEYVVDVFLVRSALTPKP